MKKRKKETKWYGRLESILIYLVIALIVFSIFATDAKKNCNEDIKCFRDAAVDCRAAKLEVISHENIYLYEIQGGEGEDCLISIKLTELAQNTPTEIIDLFDQKEMVCKIPKADFDPDELIEAQGIVDYCSGPLKEAMYELIIKRMYGVIAKNFGPILAEIEKNPFL